MIAAQNKVNAAWAVMSCATETAMHLNRLILSPDEEQAPLTSASIEQ